MIFYVLSASLGGSGTIWSPFWTNLAPFWHHVASFLDNFRTMFASFVSGLLGAPVLEILDQKRLPPPFFQHLC